MKLSFRKRDIPHMLGFSAIGACIFTMAAIFYDIYVYESAICVEPNRIILSFELFVLVPIAFAYWIYLAYREKTR